MTFPAGSAELREGEGRDQGPHLPTLVQHGPAPKLQGSGGHSLRVMLPGPRALQCSRQPG